MLVNLLALLGIIAALWVLYRGIKGNPQAFSGENLNKSFMTMGLLCLILIAVIAFTVVMLSR